MIKSRLGKAIIFIIIAISLMLFISFLINTFSLNQPKQKQNIILNDSLKTNTISKEMVADSVLSQEKASIKESFTKKKTDSNLEFPSSLPNFSAHKNVKDKKNAFFNFLKPYLVYENSLILKQRSFIIEQQKVFNTGESINEENKVTLEKYILDYRCNSTDLTNSETYIELLTRVDIIPQELALAQAALESSWGSSYFARVANNLFGQWCFTPGCGIVPRARRKGETHEVKKFISVGLSIRSYMLFLNSHPAFDLLRNERAAARARQKNPSALLMANGLEKYSARGVAYIREIKSIIRSNQAILTKPMNMSNPLVIAIQKQDSTHIWN